MRKQSPHHGHRSRMRKRYRNEGFYNFEDHQFLEFLLFYAHPRKDTNELAHLLLNHFGSFDRVLDASVEELMKVAGIGEHSAIYLKTLPEASRRYRISKMGNIKSTPTIDDAGNFLVEYYTPLEYEQITMILLDNRQKMISFEVVHDGSPSASTINIRRIVETALAKSAASIILAHNHPNGELIPSDADIATTKYLMNTFQSLELCLKEHILVANGSYLPIKNYISENAKYEVKYLVVPKEMEE